MKNHLQEGLVYLTDLSNFGRLTRGWNLERTAAFLEGYASRVEQAVEAAGGTLTAMINDSALGWFPPDRVDAGVNALYQLKIDLEGWIEASGWSSGVKIAAHYGEFMVIHLPPGETRNIIGDTVNTTFTLGVGGSAKHKDRLILSATAFRKLEKNTRTIFHKFTEPVVYLAEEE